MLRVLQLPLSDLIALVSGEIVVAESERGTLSEGDELDLEAGPARPAEELKPAYRRWSYAAVPEGRWTGVVVAVHPAQAFDADSGASRHLLTRALQGDVVVLRVYSEAGPVLSDVAFDARVRSLEGSLRG
jgi:hypothetical protein